MPSSKGQSKTARRRASRRRDRTRAERYRNKEAPPMSDKLNAALHDGIPAVIRDLECRGCGVVKRHVVRVQSRWAHPDAHVKGDRVCAQPHRVRMEDMDALLAWWVVEQRVGGSWVACGHGPYPNKAQAEAEFAAIVGSGMTAGPFRVQPVGEP